jgi:hypothetical protein
MDEPRQWAVCTSCNDEQKENAFVENEKRDRIF